LDRLFYFRFLREKVADCLLIDRLSRIRRVFVGEKAEARAVLPYLLVIITVIIIIIFILVILFQASLTATSRSLHAALEGLVYLDQVFVFQTKSGPPL
jgi:hypothetical protein